MSLSRPDQGQFLELLHAALATSRPPKIVYRDLAEGLIKAIECGMLSSGVALPGERELAEALMVSRTTVRKAMEQLVDDGILVRRHGARTVVAERVEKPLGGLTSFSEDMRSRGLVPGFVWLSREVSAASPAEMMALGLGVGEAVTRLHRLRTGSGTPMAIERAAIPARFLPDPGTVTSSLYEIMALSGCRPVRALQRLRAAVAGDEDARHLAIEAGGPLLIAERRCFAANGEAVEYTETRYCGERYDFVVELKQTQS